MTRSNRRTCRMWSQQQTRTEIARKCEECNHSLCLTEAGTILCPHCGIEFPPDSLESSD